MAMPAPSTAPLADRFGRTVTYLRISVTDRCDLRCRYCMAEAMSFMPRSAVLSLEEIAALAERFIARGVRKIRLSGGEPLVRRGVPELARTIGRHLGSGLDELTLTTNATQLEKHAEALFGAGIRRINVSLDSLDPERFRHITRWGDLSPVLAGIAAAKRAGLRVKINMVALRDFNDDEIEPMAGWCASEGHDLTLIETMPLGAVDEDRTDRYLALDGVRRSLAERYTLIPLDHSSGGPARYVQVAELGLRLGFITPLSGNFCAGCNRVRMTATGTLFPCLGGGEEVDLRAALREGVSDAVDRALDRAMALKRRAHDFDIAAAAPAVPRHMSVTGG